MRRGGFAFTAQRGRTENKPWTQTGPPILKIAFFSGGTGGHLTPGIAVAEALKEKGYALDSLFFLGKRRGEQCFAPSIKGRCLQSYLPSPGKGPFVFGTHLFQRTLQIRRLIISQGVKKCLGLGGYASLPGVLAALCAGIPVILLEQNRIVGRANRVLSRFASLICLSFPDSAPLSSRRNAIWTGNPVRSSFLRLRCFRSERFSSKPVQVAILGGSQGAMWIDRTVVGALGKISKLNLPVRFIHVAGPRWREVKRAYRSFSVPAVVAPFFQDIADRIADCALAFSRAGGCSIAELLVLGIPAVLIPYPGAKDGHQLANAQYVHAHDAGLCCKQEDFTPERLLSVLLEVCNSPERWRVRALNAYKLAVPEAASKVADLVIDKFTGGKK